MERVTGIGGFFFRAADPDGLARWYQQHLGVDPAPQSYDMAPWRQQSGPTVFTAMDNDSEHFDIPARFGRTDQRWAINFRVDDLTAMVAQLTAAGIAVELDPEEYPNGWFANLHDPEGNPIQLWQPAGVDAGDATPGAPA